MSIYLLRIDINLEGFGGRIEVLKKEEHSFLVLKPQATMLWRRKNLYQLIFYQKTGVGCSIPQPPLFPFLSQQTKLIEYMNQKRKTLKKKEVQVTYIEIFINSTRYIHVGDYFSERVMPYVQPC